MRHVHEVMMCGVHMRLQVRCGDERACMYKFTTSRPTRSLSNAIGVEQS